MIIYTARKRTSKNWRPVELSWAAFLNRLRKPLRTGETMREYKAMSREDKGAAKEAAGGFVAGELKNGQRKTENVVNRCMVTLDADNAAHNAWRDATALLDVRMCCYSTHSHTPDKPRLRWIIPTDRVMSPDEYVVVARTVADWLDIDSMDPTTYEVARLMYWPTTASDGEYVFHEQEGPVLSVDEVLASYGPNEAWRDSALWPIGKGEQEVRVRQLKKLGDPREKPGIIGLFCRTFDIYDVIREFLPDVYTETAQSDRFTYAGGTTAGGARVYNDGQYLYSSHATDPAGGQSCNAFDLVRIHKWGDLDEVSGEDTPVTKLPSYAEMTAWCSRLPEVKAQMAEEKEQQMKEDFSDIAETAAGGAREGKGDADTDADTDAENSEEKDSKAWLKELTLVPKTGECEPTQNNAALILRNDPRLKGKLGYNLFRGEPQLLGNVPWRRDPVKTEGRGQPWTDTDDAGLRGYLQLKWKYRSDNDLRAALELAFHENEFHPVRDYLTGLKWDGEERLDTMLIDYLGVEDNPYTRAVSRKWMCGAVARAMHPGCKFDCVLVLVGAQGVGKSTFAATLARGWFNDSMIDMSRKEGYESIQGSWIIELSELAGMKRSEVESVKAFIGKQEDTYRAAYARRADTRPRQCVFLATTNDIEFLKDRTGERRWWPVNVTKRLDRERLRVNVDQLWAEAVVMLQMGEYLDLATSREKYGWQEMISDHSVQDELEGMLQEYLDTRITEDWQDHSPEWRRDFIQESLPAAPKGTVVRGEVCLSEIRVELLGMDRRSVGGNDALSRRLANLMNNLPGWKKDRQKTNVRGYGPQYVYRRK